MAISLIASDLYDGETPVNTRKRRKRDHTYHEEDHGGVGIQRITSSSSVGSLDASHPLSLKTLIVAPLTLLDQW